jgi:C4-dicarboxylate transporter DctQ subunit
LPYAILPFGSALLLLRFFQAALRVLKNEQNSLIVSHEVEEAIDQLRSTETQGK